MTEYDGTVIHEPEPVHVCTPPLKDFTVTPPGGPAVWPPFWRVRQLVEAGCTHYVIRGDAVSGPGESWKIACPVHQAPRPSKVGTQAAWPLGAIWRCDCGKLWAVRRNEGQRLKGGYLAGGPPQWYPADWHERRTLRIRARARFIAWLRRRL